MPARQSPRESSPGALLTRKREAAIAALLASDTVNAAAQAAGVNPKTLHRWLRLDADFRTAYDEARRLILDQALGRLQASSGEALVTLLAVCRDQEASPAARVAAARSILDLALKVRSEEDFEARLRALEDAAHAQN